ncbi:hypothetical protein [Amycolatopsis sp. WQ 127309]|uniref:hypothetical protein n=1 Tax=Amycolatopsis sp. WQ 127309 TaxID=2932773 RepID=UPI001FF52FB5|nr:hypothetical protein [Amycolatopsis sp. WQ 127309]UOZ10043.1 hypothetical protein MUY22_17925 [Amycolatopsis sp. WQ 127309]
MASPDTEELATVPLPTPRPDDRTTPHQVITDPAAPSPDAASDAETAPHGQVAGSAASAADAETASHQVITDPADAATAPHQVIDPAALSSDASTEAAAPTAGNAAAAEQADAAPTEADATSPAAVEQAAAEPAKPAKPRGRWWRGFTGSLAAGLTVLAVGVLVVAGVCLYTDAPGPGPVLLIGHPIAAVLALLAQRVADRRNGLPAAGAGIAVVLFVVSALTLFWLT